MISKICTKLTESESLSVSGVHPRWESRFLEKSRVRVISKICTKLTESESLSVSGVHSRLGGWVFEKVGCV